MRKNYYLLDFFILSPFTTCSAFLSFSSHFCSHLKNPDPASAGVNEISPLTMKKMKNHPLRNHCSLFFFLPLLQSLAFIFITLFFIVTVCSCSLMFWLIDFVSLVLTVALLLKHSVFPSTKEIDNLLYEQIGCWIWCHSNSELSIQKG